MFRGRSGLAGLAARSNNPEDRREVDSDNNRQAWYSQTPPSQLISMEHIVRHSVIHIHSQAGVVVVAIRHGPDGTGLPPAPGPLPPSPPGPHTPPDPWGDGCGDSGSLSPAPRLSRVCLSQKGCGRGGVAYLGAEKTFATNHLQCLVFTSDCPS